MRRLLRCGLSVFIGAALSAPQARAAVDPPLVGAGMQTQPTASGVVNAAVLVRNAARPGESRVVATAALGGLEVYDLQGKRLSASPAGEAASVDVAYDVPLGDGKATLLATVDTTGNRLRLFALRGDALDEVGARALPLGFAAEGVCLSRNPLDRALYAFVVGDGGEVDQQILYATAGGKMDARQVRRISVPSPLKQCVADAQGHVYASEETVGLWRFNADPEADVAATLIDTPRLGQIEEETGGLALYDGNDGSRWLIASDTSAGRINVYDRANDDAYLGSFRVAAPQASEAIGEPGPLFATGAALGAAFPDGVLLVTDEETSNYKAISPASIAAALTLEPAAAGVSATPRIRKWRR